MPCFERSQLFFNYQLFFGFWAKINKKQKKKKKPSYIPGYNMSRCHVFRWSCAKNCAPAPTSTHVLFLKLAGRGDWWPVVGWRFGLWPLDADEGKNHSTNYRPLDVHSSCTTVPVKAAEQRTFCSLVSAMEDFRDFDAHFRRKNKFVELDLIRI